MIMKKAITIISIVIAFMACGKDNLVLEVPSSDVENNEIKVNLTITRADAFGSTKATVKSAFANNDVVYIFFKGIEAPKYLEMKYNSGTDSWSSTLKNSLVSSDISSAADKKMTAIYLPYGNTATVAASGTDFVFSDLTYTGYFLTAEQVNYTYVGGVLSGTLNMIAPTLSNASDKLIHFDTSGFTSGHNYKLSQDYVKPLSFVNVSAEGIITNDEGTIGDYITGYEDGSMLSFSGILDASAVGNAVDYQFTIDDVTTSILYTRDAGTKTLSESKYIGIGAINNSSVWNAFEYVDLGLNVRWAKCNVGATTETGYGDYYSWGDVEPYYEAGYSQEYPQNHWKSGKTDGYNWLNYKWCNGSVYTLTKYNTENSYGPVDNKTVLDLFDDAAHVNWDGNWRTPTYDELNELHNNCTWIWYDTGNSEFNSVRGYKVSSNKPGYTERFIFLPAAGYLYGTDHEYVGTRGYYWSNTLTLYQPGNASELIFSYSGHNTNMFDRQCGLSVRPVCP